MTTRRRDWKAYVDGIRRILITEWDPIWGPFGFHAPEHDDEYDTYIPKIYLLMQERAKVFKLASHLGKLETQSMGLSARPQINQRVAKKLLDLNGC